MGLAKLLVIKSSTAFATAEAVVTSTLTPATYSIHSLRAFHVPVDQVHCVGSFIASIHASLSLHEPSSRSESVLHMRPAITVLRTVRVLAFPQISLDRPQDLKPRFPHVTECVTHLFTGRD